MYCIINLRKERGIGACRLCCLNFFIGEVEVFYIYKLGQIDCIKT